MPDSFKTDVIYIFAPLNCPVLSCRQADAMAEALRKDGYAVERIQSVAVFIDNPSKAQIRAADRFAAIHKKFGEPITIVNHYAKAHATSFEAVQELQRTRGH